MDDDIHRFCQQQQEWLELELQSSSSSSTEEVRSRVLHNLNVDDVSVGLYGRTVVILASATQSFLPAHRLTTGDEVELRSKTLTKTKNPRGVVSQVTETSISVSVDTLPSPGFDADFHHGNPSPPLTLVPTSAVEIHRKIDRALQELARFGTNHPVASRIVRAAFGGATRTEPPPQQQVDFLNSSSSSLLDDSQKAAIQFCLHQAGPIALIHGPPGTGKTTTVTALIGQAIALRHKLLVCAPSNVAVDTVLGRLATHPKLKMVRLGHPARMQADILKYSLEHQVHQAEGTEIVADVRAELKHYLNLLASKKATDKRLAYQEIGALRKELRQREEAVVQGILKSSQVVLATCVGSANRLLRDVEFDIVIIDEAAQALEAECWIPALKASKLLILAGDHCQLPPTIQSSNPQVQQALSETMFERIMKLYGDEQVSRMLQVQYRMNQDIADWASQALYNDLLKTHESVKDRTLAQLTCNESDIAETVLLLIDTARCDMHESVNAAGSRFNTGEAQIVTQHVKALLDLGLKQNEIAIITPYNGQVELLRSSLLPDHPKLEIRSVDGFQGGEREAVVLSLVRSSERGGMDGIGFLKENRRLNVAVTRAKRHCCVICDSETVSQSPFIKNLLEWIEEHGEHRSALEYMEDDIHQGQVDSDLLQAQIEMELMKGSQVRGGNKLTPNAKAQVPKKKQKAPRPVDDERRKELIAKIQSFAFSGIPGDELKLSSELTSFDRRLVHEQAEKLGLGHRSEGLDGVDRRILLWIETSVAASGIESLDLGATSPLQPTASASSDRGAVTAEEDHIETDGVVVDEQGSERAIERLAFEALVDEDSDGDEIAEEPDSRNVTDTHSVPAGPQSSTNPTLKDLARERAERGHAKMKGQSASQKKLTSQKKPKGKTQKLGGSQPKLEPVDHGVNDLEEMAFLDAQIDKVQNSHGRKFQGNGGYRTIMNGILLAKPAAPEPKKDARALAALQGKIKQAQSDRTAKPKKKK